MPESILVFSNPIIALLILCSLMGCNPQWNKGKATQSGNIAEIEQILKVKFPSDAKIVFSEEKTREDNKSWYKREIIFSSKPIQFHNHVTEHMPAEIVVASMNASGIEPLGKLIDKNAHIFETHIKDMSWKVYQAQFDTGIYIDVWRFRGADVWEVE